MECLVCWNGVILRQFCAHSAYWWVVNIQPKHGTEVGKVADRLSGRGETGAGVRQGSEGDSDSSEEIDSDPEGDTDDDNGTEEALQLRRSTRSTRRTTSVRQGGDG
jgi:hypothetical protein